ncbi:hypothetical protein M0805_009416 [Coniferiporia weirii]|nr:hypothetical protein M0805_009416 [Coniferiporia weirii]
MSFALGSLAIMSSFRPFELSSISRVSALFELRSMVLAIVVILVLVVLAYLTNPTETSFRAFLTEQAFRHHLSRLDDVDAQEELEPSGNATRPDLLSKRGPSNSLKHRAISAYASPPFAFANRASVSLRTPKHIFRSFGILSIAAVVPSSPSNRLSSSVNRIQHSDEDATREDKDGDPGAYASLICDSWFIGAFGMWFWAVNLDGFWKIAGFVVKGEVDGTVSGVLELKALDRSDESNRTSFTSNGSLNHSQRPSPKLRSRERFAHQSGQSHNHRSQTPPPLPKSASLPLHTKRGAHPLTPERSQSHGPTVPNAPENRCISSHSLPVPVSPVPSSSPSRSPSSLFGSSPLIAEILRQLTASQSALADLRTQLSDFHTTSASGRSALDEQLEKQRTQKRNDDAAKSELKIQTKTLEDQKRAAEGARRDAEKRLRMACAERDGTIARTERLEREMFELQMQMEAQGAEIVASGVEAGALAADLAEQVDARRSEIRVAEEDITQLGARVREIEEKVTDEEHRLKSALANAEARKRERMQVQMQTRDEFGLSNGSVVSTNGGGWHVLPQLQTRQTESKPLEITDVFPPSPITDSMPESPLSIAPSEVQLRPHVSSPSLPIPVPDANNSMGQSIFDTDLHIRRSRANTQSRGFAPFNETTSPGPLSPTGESLLPASLYKSLGMGTSAASPVSPVSSAGMDVSRSFQSEDDIILDRDWFNYRNQSAGDVGQPLVFPSRASSGTETSPVSPAISAREVIPCPPDVRTDVRERVGSLRMDAQRAAFPYKSSGTDAAVAQTALDSISSGGMETPNVAPNVARRSGWFTSSKDKNTKAHEKKGLNPDAKAFSLSKDKERSFSAFLSRSRGSSGSVSGNSSAPSSASLPTPDSASLVNSPIAPASTTTPLHASSRAAGSLLSLSSSWFGSSRAFAPTPLEREQLCLGRVLGGAGNASLDHLPSLPMTSPRPKHALPHAHSVGVLPRPWDTGSGIGAGLSPGSGVVGSGSKANFCPFEDEPSADSLSSSPTDESACAGSNERGGMDMHSRPVSFL